MSRTEFAQTGPSLRVGTIVLILGLILVVAACGDGEGAPDAACVEGDTDGCHMVAVSFDRPMKLAAVRALVADWPGTLHGVWREDWICLETAGFGFTEEAPASRFAYLGAASIPDRVAELGPPPTDGGQSSILWNQRIEALDRMIADDPGIAAAAMWLPTEFDVPDGLTHQVVAHRYAFDEAKVLYVGAPGYRVDPALDVTFPWDTAPPDCST